MMMSYQASFPRLSNLNIKMRPAPASKALPNYAVLTMPF